MMGYYHINEINAPVVVGGGVSYIDPYQDTFEYIAIILTSSTITAIGISVYSPLNI